MTCLLRLLIVGLALGLGACIEAEPPNRIFITGDYSSSLDYLWTELWLNNQSWARAASYPDSNQIRYPAFYLQISREAGVLRVRPAESDPLQQYFVVSPKFSYDGNRIECKALKLILGTSIVNGEIQNADDSRSVILDGKLSRQ